MKPEIRSPRLKSDWRTIWVTRSSPLLLGDMGVLSSKIKPGDHFNSKITFSVDNVRSRYKLGVLQAVFP